jgi:hypothetical protein
MIPDLRWACRKVILVATPSNFQLFLPDVEQFAKLWWKNLLRTCQKCCERGRLRGMGAGLRVGASAHSHRPLIRPKK